MSCSVRERVLLSAVAALMGLFVWGGWLDLQVALAGPEAVSGKATKSFSMEIPAAKKPPKTEKLRQAEEKLVKFLVKEGLVLEADGSVSPKALADLFIAWDDLNAAQADSKMSKYSRLVRPVLLLGGNELGLKDETSGRE